MSSSSSSDFLLTCQYRGHIHNSGPPFRQLACCTHDISHTRSPGVSIMRVDSWELPLSAIPLCQLLALEYIPCTRRTINSSTPSFLSAHQMTFLGTRSNAFSRSTKAMSSLLLAARYFSCSCLTTKIASVVPLPGTKPNLESSIDTTCLIRPSKSSPGLSWIPKRN